MGLDLNLVPLGDGGLRPGLRIHDPPQPSRNADGAPAWFYLHLSYKPLTWQPLHYTFRSLTRTLTPRRFADRTRDRPLKTLGFLNGPRTQRPDSVGSCPDLG
jgi:hypothetical protein